MACKFWEWIKKEFSHVKTDVAKIAVAITEDVQSFLKSGVAGALADVISAVFPSVKNLPAQIVSKLQELMPKILATELAVQGLPDNPTEQDIIDFERRVLDAFNISDQKSKIYTSLAAQVYGLLHEAVSDGKLTFAECVKLVEEAYQDLLKLKADAEAEGTEVD